MPDNKHIRPWGSVDRDGNIYIVEMLPDDQIESLYNKNIVEHNLKPDVIEKQLNEVKEKGFAYRKTQFGDLPGNHTLACPIFNYSGEIVGVIGMIGFSHDYLSLDVNGEEVTMLKTIGEDVSKELSHVF